MTTEPTAAVIRHLRDAVPIPDADELTDAQLLGRVIDGRDEAAFAVLVKRHGPMVWGVCRRQLGRHDAEDAFQAAFLVLFRKASSVRPREMLANWLHGVARRAALQAKRNAARRGARERQVIQMPEPTAAKPDPSDDLRSLIDRELGRLPDRYRAVVVLCDLEGRTRKEVARQLGLPEGTVGSRLARARAMLGKRLARYGLPSLAAAMSEEAAPACVPASLVTSTIKAATGAIPVRVAALAEGVLRAMLLTKTKTLVVLLAVGLVCAGAGVSRYPARGDEPSAAEPERGPMPGGKKADPFPFPGAVKLEFDKDIRIDVRSNPVKAGGHDLHIVSVGTGTFRLSDKSHLTATLKAAVAQYAKVEYRINAAVFDAQGRMLGTASHVEQVQYIRIGAMPTIFREIELDFGTSRAFEKAAYVVVSISDPEVPKP